MTTTYLVNDADGSLTVEAASAVEAAQKFAAPYDGESTFWVRCRVQRLGEDGTPAGDSEEVTIQIDPEAPECVEGSEHDWQSPYSVLGGLADNPGVWGHGGGTVLKRCCARCGAYRITDTWAQNPETGEQGLESVRYEEADETSSEWVQGLRDTAAVDSLVDIAEAQIRRPGRLYIPDYAPDSSDNRYKGDTSPGSPWDEECDRLLAEIQTALPAGWDANWSDDDLLIDWVGE